MTREDAEELQADIQGIAKILYKNTNRVDLVSLEAIEKSVPQQMKRTHWPSTCFFLSNRSQGQTKVEQGI